MFASRQLNEIQPLLEVSRCVPVIGAVAAGTTVNVAATACFVGNATGTAGSAATFTNGDQLEVFPGASNIGGIVVTAAPGAVAGSVSLSFTNTTAGSITPTAGAIYTVIATRINATVI